MKFVIRRSAVALIASPFIAGAYVLFYTLLVLAGGTPTESLAGVWGIGWQVALAVGIVFVLIGKWSNTPKK